MKRSIESNAQPKIRRSVDVVLQIFLLIVLVILVLVIRSNFVGMPFERDEGVYAQFASLIVQGRLPYEAFYDPKPPGLFFTYALLLKIFGSTAMSLQWVFTGIHVLTVIMLFRLGRYLFGSIGGLASASAFAMLSLNPHLGGMSILSEHLLIFFEISAIIFLVKGHEAGRLWQIGFSGMLMGMTFFLKQNGLFFIAFGCTYLLISHAFNSKSDVLNFIKKVGVFLAASLTPFGMIFIYISTLGWQEEFLYWNFEYTLRAEFTAPFSEGLRFFITTWLQMMDGRYHWFIPIALAAILLSIRTSKSRHGSLMWCLSIFSLISITPRWTFHGHYFILVLPVLGLWVGYAFDLLGKWLRNIPRYRSLSSFVSTALLTLFVVYDMVDKADLFFSPNVDAISRSVYGSNPFVEVKNISAELTKRKKAGDALLVLGSEMQIYFYTGLIAPTKHLYGPYLVDGTSEHRQRQEELILDVEKARPRFVIMVNHPLSWVAKLGSSKGIFQWYESYTKADYSLIGLADMHARGQTNYIWDSAISTYEISGQHQVFVWERI